ECATRMCDLVQMMSHSLSHIPCAAGASRLSTAAPKNFIARFGTKFVHTGAHPDAPAMNACKLLDAHAAINETCSPVSSRIAVMRVRSPVLSLIQLQLSSLVSRARNSGFMSTPVVHGLL